MTVDEKREFFMRYIWSFVEAHTWYKWGGSTGAGIDCSGLVCEGLQSVGILNHLDDFSADGLLRLFRGLGCEVPEPGRSRLVFWLSGQGGDKKAVHVEVCVSDEIAVGAKGGGSNCLTVEDAIRMNAFVKPRPIASRLGDKAYIDPFKALGG